MSKDEMIKDMETAISKAWGLKYEGGLLVKELANLGYRKVADDEIVESMKTYERARQETVREILKDLNNRYNECGGAEDVAIMLYDWLSEMGKKYDIELE